jgi:hypothetical protein
MARSRRACPERSLWLFRSFVLLHIQPAVLQAPQQRRHPERSAAQIYRITEDLWRKAEGTPATLPGRCSWELSGHRLQGKLKKSQPPSEAERLQFHSTRNNTEGSPQLSPLSSRSSARLIASVTNRWVAQVSLLRPGILATDPAAPRPAVDRSRRKTPTLLFLIPTQVSCHVELDTVACAPFY